MKLGIQKKFLAVFLLVAFLMIGALYANFRSSSPLCLKEYPVDSEITHFDEIKINQISGLGQSVPFPFTLTIKGDGEVKYSGPALLSGRATFTKGNLEKLSPEQIASIVSELKKSGFFSIPLGERNLLHEKCFGLFRFDVTYTDIFVKTGSREKTIHADLPVSLKQLQNFVTATYNTAKMPQQIGYPSEILLPYTAEMSLPH